MAEALGVVFPPSRLLTSSTGPLALSRLVMRSKMRWMPLTSALLVNSAPSTDATLVCRPRATAASDSPSRFAIRLTAGVASEVSESSSVALRGPNRGIFQISEPGRLQQTTKVLSRDG